MLWDAQGTLVVLIEPYADEEHPINNTLGEGKIVLGNRRLNLRSKEKTIEHGKNEFVFSRRLSQDSLADAYLDIGPNTSVALEYVDTTGAAAKSKDYSNESRTDPIRKKIGEELFSGVGSNAGGGGGARIVRATVSKIQQQTERQVQTGHDGQNQQQAEHKTTTRTTRVQTTSWHPSWPDWAEKYTINGDLMRETTDAKTYDDTFFKPKTSAEQQQPPFYTATGAINDSYVGNYGKVPVEAGNQHVQDECNKNMANFVKNYNSMDWAVGVGWNAPNTGIPDVEAPYNRGAVGKVDVVDQNNMVDASKGKVIAYRGPCLWCRKGQGDWAPEKVPVPWIAAMTGSNAPSNQSIAALDNKTTLSFDSNRFDDERFVRVKVPLGKRGQFGYVCNRCACIWLTGQEQAKNASVRVAVQPNGGVQIAWQEWHRERGIVHVTYLKPDLTRAAEDIVLEATGIAGIVAFDTGTALLVTQHDCDAPSNGDRAWKAIKPMLFRWDNGALKWKKRLMTQRKTASDQVAGGDYALDVGRDNMLLYKNGKYHFSLVKSYGRRGIVSGGGHVMYGAFVVSDTDGAILESTNMCSHPQGARVAANENVVVRVCNDDVYGIQPGLSPEIKTVAYGQSPVTFGSLAPIGPSADNKFVLVYTRRNESEIKAVVDGVYKHFNRVMVMTMRTEPKNATTDLAKPVGPVIKELPHSTLGLSPIDDVYNLHLVPWRTSATGHSANTFLLHLTAVACCASTTSSCSVDSCSANTASCKPRDMYYAVTVTDSADVKVLETKQTTHRIYEQDQPRPFRRGLLWGTLEDIEIVPYNWIDRPANMGRGDTTTSTSVTLTYLRMF